MDSHDVFKQAVEGHVKGIAMRLGVHVNTVYKMLSDPEFCRYTRWLPLFIALYEENPIGGEEVFEDFRAVVLRLREDRAQKKTESVDWPDGIAKAVEESSQAIIAAIESRDQARIRKEVTEAIDAYRQLLRLEAKRSERGPRAIAAGGR